jgi:WD40 repeat protein
VAFAPDGASVVSSGNEQVAVWEPLSGRLLRVLDDLPMRAGRLGTLTLSPDGSTLAAGYNKGEIRLWDVATGKERLQFKGHENYVVGCAYSHDGRVLASIGFDDAICLWDPATGKELRRMTGQKRGSQLAFAPEGKTLATASTDAGGDFTVRLWDAETGKEVWQVTTKLWSAFALAFSPDGRLLALVGGLPGRLNDTGEVRLWDAATGKEIRRCEGYDERVHAVTFSPDGRTLATCGGTENVIRLWEVATGLERRQFRGHRGYVHALTFSPDGQLLGSGSTDTTALVWDVTGSFRDGRFQPSRLAEKEREDRWADLTSTDAGKAYRAIQSFAADESVPFLRERLRLPLPADPKQLAALIRDLGSPEFAAREQATKELIKLGFRAEAALRESLDGSPGLEVQRRLTALLEKLTPAGSPESLRLLRAVEVLEHIGTAEARTALAQLAKEASGTWLEREAKASVERLVRRDRRQP